MLQCNIVLCHFIIYIHTYIYVHIYIPFYHAFKIEPVPSLPHTALVTVTSFISVTHYVHVFRKYSHTYLHTFMPYIHTYIHTFRYGVEVEALPDPSVNLPEFVQRISDFNQTHPPVFDVARGKSCDWVNCNALTSTYDPAISSGGICSCM